MDIQKIKNTNVTHIERTKVLLWTIVGLGTVLLTVNMFVDYSHSSLLPFVWYCGYKLKQN